MSSKTSLKAIIEMDEQDTFLANITSRIEERRCDLICRHRNLRDKVITMERFIPALMAYNMQMADRDTSYCKVREIMKKFSSDPTDRLLIKLRTTVNDLHRETTHLHDKIIDADMKLEETGMELESLELANKEMEEKLVELRDEMQMHNTSSLNSIHSEDLIYLKKIRQLAEEELRLKNGIKELESKEITYTKQMNQLLFCKEFKCSNRKMVERMQEFEEDGKKSCYLLGNHKHNGYPSKRNFTLKNKDQTRCACLTAMNGYQEALKKSSRKKYYEDWQIRARSSSEKILKASGTLCSPSSCRIRLNSSASRRRSTTRSCNYTTTRLLRIPCKQISTVILKSKCPFSTIPLCESSVKAVSKTGYSQSSKQFTQSSVPCNFGTTCEECESFAACKEIDGCTCDCKGKCARKISDVPCNCNVISSYSIDKCQPTVMETPHSGLEAPNNHSNEEFCECCSCICEGGEIMFEKK